jgi:hypothetical protein
VEVGHSGPRVHRVEFDPVDPPSADSEPGNHFPFLG